MTQKDPTLDMLADPRHFLSLGFGSGLVPVAPGTAGTLVAIPIYLLMAGLQPWLYFVATLVLFLLGIYLCDYTSRYLGVHDHSGIVWDEVVGYLLTMWLVPLSLGSVVLGFLAFRLFDVWKPWPIRSLDRRVTGGLGIMLDDVAAAVYAGVTVHVVLRFTDLI